MPLNSGDSINYDAVYADALIKAARTGNLKKIKKLIFNYINNDKFYEYKN